MNIKKIIILIILTSNLLFAKEKNKELIVRDKIRYEKGTKIPYSGKFVDYYKKENNEKLKIKSITIYKNGKKIKNDSWYYDGKKRSKCFYKNGKKNGICTEWSRGGKKILKYLIKMENEMVTVKDGIGMEI